MDLVDSVGAEVHIESFMQEGPASPTLASVFKVGQPPHARLFLIVKWHYYLPGINTDGDFYEVNAYTVDSTGTAEDQQLSKMLALDSMGGRMG